jgi:hypothetical protein
MESGRTAKEEGNATILKERIKFKKGKEKEGQKQIAWT